MTDLLTMLQEKRAKRHAPGPLSQDAADLCGIVWHQFTITWQHQSDQQNDMRAVEKRLRAVELRLHELENRGVGA